MRERWRSLSGLTAGFEGSTEMKKRTQASSFRKNGTVRFAIFACIFGCIALFAVPQIARFEDVTARAQINFRNEASHTSRKYLPETMGGGVAMFDYNRDGLLDLFFVNGAALSDPMLPGKAPDKIDPKYWNRLYRNNGDGTFTDATEQAGVKGTEYGMGVAVADYDNDGYPDLYVTNVGHNILYHNNRDGTFTDVTNSAGVGADGWSAGAMFIDYDRDGLLDLFVSRYLTWDFSKDIFCGQTKPGFRAYCHPDQFQPITHMLFHNEGHGQFRDVSKESGIANFPGKGLGVAMNDYDRDGWPDIFINALALQRYALFHNRAGNFDYVSGPLGIAATSATHSGWGTKFVDYDNDGLKDLFIGQGHVMDNIQLTQPEMRYLEAPMLLRNNSGRFVDVSSQSGPIFQRALAARGVAFGDFNNDSFVDMALNCNEEPAVLLRNTRNANHWLVVDTVGTKSNHDGIGAQLHLITEDGNQQHATVTTASSYLSASDKRVYFGIGRSINIKVLEIQWPSGIVQRFTRIKPDRIFIAREKAQAP
jgi:enediyne biosynthesis protein E4